MTEKNKPLECFAGGSQGLLKKDRVKRFSILKKDTKGFAQRILNDDSITLLAGKFKSNVLRHVLFCADYLKIRKLFLTGETKIIHASLCKKHLLCSFCAHLRASKIIQHYLKIYKEVVKKQKSYHMVFTIKDGSDLQERYNHLNKSINLLLSARRQGRGQMAKITSGVYAYEFKRGKKSGIWHPHIHMIGLTSEYIDFSKLRADWKEITKDSFEVHVQEFYGDSSDDILIKPFLEVFKYSLKLPSLADSDRIEAYRILYGRRLVNSFGDFRGFKEPELMDEISDKDVFYIDCIMRYTDDKGYQIMENDLIFSEQFKPVLQLQEMFKIHGEKMFTSMDNLAMDTLQEKTGFDFKDFIITMLRENIKTTAEIESYFKKQREKIKDTDLKQLPF